MIRTLSTRSSLTSPESQPPHVTQLESKRRAGKVLGRRKKRVEKCTSSEEIRKVESKTPGGRVSGADQTF